MALTCLPLLPRNNRHLYRLGVTVSALFSVRCAAHTF
jgi:hypothetical protein